MGEVVPGGRASEARAAYKGPGRGLAGVVKADAAVVHDEVADAQAVAVGDEAVAEADAVVADGEAAPAAGALLLLLLLLRARVSGARMPRRTGVRRGVSRARHADRARRRAQADGDAARAEEAVVPLPDRRLGVAACVAHRPEVGLGNRAGAGALGAQFAVDDGFVAARRVVRQQEVDKRSPVLRRHVARRPHRWVRQVGRQRRARHGDGVLDRVPRRGVSGGVSTASDDEARDTL